MISRLVPQLPCLTKSLGKGPKTQSLIRFAISFKFLMCTGFIHFVEKLYNGVVEASISPLGAGAKVSYPVAAPMSRYMSTKPLISLAALAFDSNLVNGRMSLISLRWFASVFEFIFVHMGS